MQYIDNDMDDLFRRAADGYPLKTGNGDWNTVLERIQVKVEEPVLPPAPAKNLHKKLMAVVVVLLISLPLGYYLISKSNRLDAVKENENIQVAVADKETKKKLAHTRKHNNSSSQAPLDTAFSLPIAKENVKENQHRPHDKNTVNYAARSTINMVDAGISEEDVAGIQPTHLKAEALRYQVLLKSNKTISITAAFSEQAAVAAASFKKNSSVTRAGKRLYAGVIAGLDFCKGTSMAFNSSGVNAGLVLGYRLSNSIAVETGVDFGKKQYAGNGIYFNMDKVKDAMPQGMVINDLQSNTSVLEIPVRIKYDFIRRRQSAFFITGGVAAYIVTRELNQYNVSVNGQQQKLMGRYSNNSFHFPASALFNAGYQHTVSDKINIRIEPFLKTPLNGIGMGNMRVTTAGIQLAITSQL